MNFDLSYLALPVYTVIALACIGYGVYLFDKQCRVLLNLETSQTTNMKKYTIIYLHGFQCGSHSNSITRFDRIETDNLTEFCKADKYFGNLCFIFEGWPRLEGEDF